MSSDSFSHYKSSGVDYDRLDVAKRSAVSAAASTSRFLLAAGGQAIEASRGEPAFVFELGGLRLAMVMEGLGTKAVISRRYMDEGGANRFADVAYDTVAAILNDLLCVGALPVAVNAYFATGSSEWYDDADRRAALLEGWRQACEDASCTWGGGESPSLPGLVDPAEIELAGCAVGMVPDGIDPVLGDLLGAGDEVVLIESSGLHANGASLARKIADELPDGLRTEVADGRDLGDLLCAPSILYAALVRRLLTDGHPVTYLSHITGHGFLKLMRPAQPLTYRISELLPVPPVLAFLADRARMDDRAAYATFNMGAGFAVYVRAGAGAAVVEVARELGLRAIVAGQVEEGPRRVLVDPLGLTYEDAELDLGR